MRFGINENSEIYLEDQKELTSLSLDEATRLLKELKEIVYLAEVNELNLGTKN